MTDPLESHVPLKKRRMADWGTSDGVSVKTTSFALLGSTQLLLQIPAHANRTLPVWQCVHRSQAEVSWCETPYSITIRITPLLPRADAQSPCQNQPPTTDHLTPFNQALVPMHPPLTIDCPSMLIQPPPPCVASQQIQTVAILPSQTMTLLPSFDFGGYLYPVHQPIPSIQTTTDALPTDGINPGTGLLSLLAQPVPREEWVQQAYFHTRPRHNVGICDRFLLGCCQWRSECPQHHTPYPFHWQFRRRDTQQWISASHSAQLRLERLYSDHERESIRLREMSEEFVLNLDTMLVEYSEKYDAARRLSNTSDPAKNPHFPTEWKIYWRDSYRWECYKKDVTKQMVAKMEAREASCRFFIGKQQYELDFNSLTQENLTTGYIRKVRCRPTFRSPMSIKSHLRTIILSEGPESSCQSFPNFNVDPLEVFNNWLPPVWVQDNDQHQDNRSFRMVDVPFGTEAYHKVHSLFHLTLSESKIEIVSIQQVQNVFQWEKYQRQKHHMQSHLEPGVTLEKHLFHGTTQDAAMDICYNNFDPRVSGKNGVVYGHGAYFARDSSYSNDYARVSPGQRFQHMFLAKVLVGNVCLGKKKYSRPPPLRTAEGQYRLYDTCINQLDNPSIFVVFDSCQCYPYYLIKYRALSETIDLFE